jgi:lipoprotein NlpD
MPTLRLRLWALCFAAAWLLTACGGNSRAPVEDRYARTGSKPAVQVQASKNTYRVQRGDTLYSIAFRYGMDFRKIASANRIPAPYTIYPGQTILMLEGALPAPVASKPTKSPDVQPASRPPLAPKPAPVPTAAPAPARPTGEYTGSPVGKWLWPSSGKVTRGYSSSLHKGIDIAGNLGEPVLAVASGKVVYAGTGIVGFGELLIVKHNEVYLSAYGHNDRLLVKEGDVVAAGAQIAEKGSSGTDSVKLHFEIRKAGKPIDPQRLLPKR